MPPLVSYNNAREAGARGGPLRAGGASSSSIRDVRDVQHPSDEVPLHIRLQEEYERLHSWQEKRGGYVCPGYPQCENMDCDCAGPQSEEEQEEGEEEDDRVTKGNTTFPQARTPKKCQNVNNTRS